MLFVVTLEHIFLLNEAEQHHYFVYFNFFFFKLGVWMVKVVKQLLILPKTVSTSSSLTPLSPFLSLSSIKREINSGDFWDLLMKNSKDFWKKKSFFFFWDEPTTAIFSFQREKLLDWQLVQKFYRRQMRWPQFCRIYPLIPTNPFEKKINK